MIKADSLRLVSGSTVILDDVTVEIKRHQTTVIIGPSGCGKSSLLRVLAGWQPLTSGSLEPTLSSSEVGLLFQDYQLFPWHTVEKNLRLALQALKLTRKEQSERVKELAQTLELQSLLQKYPHQISGGQQQRAALGQLLAKEASYLFLDEPTSALDALTKEKIQDLLVSLQKKHSLTIVWVTHSIEEAAFLGQNVWVMEEASVIKSLQNPLAASENYRQQAHYFEQQLLLRQLLGGNQR